jgi:hypothetical protein
MLDVNCTEYTLSDVMIRGLSVDPAKAASLSTFDRMACDSDSKGAIDSRWWQSHTPKTRSTSATDSKICSLENTACRLRDLVSEKPSAVRILCHNLILLLTLQPKTDPIP